jgi:peptidase E
VEKQKVKDAADIFLVAGDPGKRGAGRDPLLSAILAQLGMARPSVAYVGAASGDSRVFFIWIAALLKKAGAGSVRLAALASRSVDPAKARAILRESDLVFVSGGDVEAGMDVLQQKNMVKFLGDLYRQGKPFFGISAGSIMLAREWIRWSDPDDDSTAEIFPCLDIAPVICDTHAEDDDWEELKALLALEKEGVKGYGIPSGGTIKVYPDGKVEALGDVIPQYINRGGKVIRLDDLVPVELT